MKSSRDLLVISLVMMVAETWAMKMDPLVGLWGHGNHLSQPSDKRAPAGNPCEQPEKPFPCKTYVKCLPMIYVCDDNYDCLDRSDEDIEMCVALRRPPVEDIEAFLSAHRKWIIPNVFGNKDINEVAHALAVSQSLEGLSRRLHLGAKGASKLRDVLEQVHDDNEEGLEKYGMPSSAWNHVRYFFTSLMKSGLD